MTTKLKAHLWTLPRWFALPFFGSSILLGAVLAGGINGNAWVGLIAGLLVMAGGHSFNTLLDYSWTGLDKGEVENRSAEKDYTGGQSVICGGILTEKEVLLNAVGWYLLSAIPIIYLMRSTGWPIVFIWVLSMAVTFWYSKAKFNWTHELSLGMGVGPLALLIGMFSVSSSPNWPMGILASAPIAIVLSFVGLALDEWPDAEANLKKGVKSMAYKVWEYGVDLNWYMTAWMMFLFILQLFLIVIGVFEHLTAVTFIVFPAILCCMVFLKKTFRKTAGILVAIAMLYPVLLLIGQIWGG